MADPRFFENRGPIAVSAICEHLGIAVEGDGTFEYRFAGHLEDGGDSISDPLMGGLVT